jgi:hypothetical protein
MNVVEFEAGKYVGEKEANTLLKKNHPKTTFSLVKLQHVLKKRLDAKYKHKQESWKQGYGRGAMDKIFEYQKESLFPDLEKKK